MDKKLEDSKARKSIALNVSNTISRKIIGTLYDILLKQSNNLPIEFFLLIRDI